MAHRWSFIRAGGVDQVVFKSGADIAHLGELDQKLWAALACPTRGLEFDTRTLDVVDTDHDGRIRAPELIAAAQWVCERLEQPDQLIEGGDGIALDDLAQDELGAALRTEAAEVLRLQGRPQAQQLVLADVADRAQLLTHARLDGDGRLQPADAGDDAPLQALLQQMAQLMPVPPGPAAVPAGMAAAPAATAAAHPGVDRATAELYLQHADALDAWYRRGADATVAPLGAQTPQALALLDRIAPRIDDYFARARLIAYDPHAAAALNANEETFKALAPQQLGGDAAALAALPLAVAAADRALSLRDGLNPFWADDVAALRDQVVQPLSGIEDPRELTPAMWQQLQQRLQVARAWVAERPANPLQDVPAARLAEWAQAQLRQRLWALFDAEAEAGRQHARIADLEKLLRLKRDLLRLLNNFVSFAEFYRRRGAIFQAGTLYLDGRSCELCIKVDNVAQHAVLAGMAKAFLAYCECRRGADKRTIVAAFTAGDGDFVLVGRNGIFYDREGRDWDATITKVIENPTSIAQAFFLPYKKFLRLLEEQVAKRAAAGEARTQAGMGSLAGSLVAADTKAVPAAKPGAPAAVPAAPRPLTRFDVGTIAALGVALGSLSAVAVGVFGKFVDLGVWIPVALLGIVLAISGPSMLIAWLKLRQRSLGPLLDASGWAVNGRMRINVRLGGSLSQTARIPKDAHHQLRDPYAERRGPLYTVLVLGVLAAAVLAWRLGIFAGMLAR